MFLTPKWMLSHLFVLTMLVIMTAAGFWQLDRLDERRASNDEIRAASEAEPALIEDILARIDAGEDVLDQTCGDRRGSLWRRPGLLVANRTFDTQPGFWFVSPVELGDGRIVAVSRGWIPRDVASGEGPQAVTMPVGPVTITGRAFATVGGGRIGTRSPAALRSTAWISTLSPKPSASTWSNAGCRRWTPPGNEAMLPIPVPPPNLNDGPHLSYAFQWFFFTTGTIIAYALILRHRRRDAQIEALRHHRPRRFDPARCSRPRSRRRR